MTRMVQMSEKKERIREEGSSKWHGTYKVGDVCTHVCLERLWKDCGCVLRFAKPGYRIDGGRFDSQNTTGNTISCT